MRISSNPLFSAQRPKETRNQALARQALKYAQDKTILTFETAAGQTQTWNLHQALTWLKTLVTGKPDEELLVTQFKSVLRNAALIPANQAERVVELMTQNPSFFDPGQSGMRANRLAGRYPKESMGWKEVVGLTELGKAVVNPPAPDSDPSALAKAAKAYREQLAQTLPAETQLAQSITLATPKAEALGKTGTLVWRVHDQVALMGKLLLKSKKFDDQTRPALSVKDITDALKKLAKFTAKEITAVIDGMKQANNGAWVVETPVAKRPHYTLSPQGWNLAQKPPAYEFTGGHPKG